MKLLGLFALIVSALAIIIYVMHSYWLGFRNLWNTCFGNGFARYGGCTAALLQHCDDHTKQLRGQSGMLLFGVVAVSSMTAGLSWWRITGSEEVGIGFAVAWFVLFSLLDRTLMATLDGVSPSAPQGENKWDKWKRITRSFVAKFAAYGVRVAIVALVAHVNTAVVQQYVFAADIETIIANRAKALELPAIQKRDAANRAYGQVITGWEEYLAKERNILREYEDAGKTQEATELKKRLAEKEADFKKIRDDGVEKKALMSAELELIRVREHAAEPVGPSDREDILAELAKSRPIIKYLYWMIFTIELAAFIAKAIRRKDQYDELVTKYHQQASNVQLPTDDSVEVMDNNGNVIKMRRAK